MDAIVDQKCPEECLPLLELWLIKTIANYMSNCAKEYEKGLSASHLSINYCNEYLNSVYSNCSTDCSSQFVQMNEVSNRVILELVSHNQMSEASRISNLKNVINSLTNALPNTAQVLCVASAVQQQLIETRNEFTASTSQTQSTGSKLNDISEPQTNESEVSNSVSNTFIGKGDANQGQSAAPKKYKTEMSPESRIEGFNKVGIPHNFEKRGQFLFCIICEETFEDLRSHIITRHLSTQKHLHNLFGIGKHDVKALLKDYPFKTPRQSITREVSDDLNGLHAFIKAYLNPPPSNASTLNLNDLNTRELLSEPIESNHNTTQNTTQNTGYKPMIYGHTENQEPIPSDKLNFSGIFENETMSYEDDPMPSPLDPSSPVEKLDLLLSIQQSVDQMSDQTDGQTGKTNPLKSPNSDPLMSRTQPDTIGRCDPVQIFN